MNIFIPSFGNKSLPQQNSNPINPHINKGNKTDQSDIGSLRDEFKKNEINIPEPTPLMSGLGSAVAWFGFGFLFDRLLGKISKSLKTPLKLSLGINGAIGLIAGIASYIKAKKSD